MTEQINIADLSNRLSNNDLCQLISALSNRIDVFIAGVGVMPHRMQLSGNLSEENPACLNGSVVQINMEFTDDEGRDFLETYGDYLQLTEQEKTSDD
jgi:DNA-binding transcriptional regulator LsrR (DeoR family)